MLVAGIHYPELSKLTTDRLWQIYAATMNQIERCYKLVVEHNCSDTAMNVYLEYKTCVVEEIDRRKLAAR